MIDIYRQGVEYIALLTMRDYIEILFFIVMIYRIGLWLQRDQQKTLLGFVYSYGLLAGISYVCMLHSITLFLIMSAPVISIVCVVLHSDTLQKNYVAVRNAQPTIAYSDDWLAILMRFCVRSMHDGRSLKIIIEHHDSMSTLLKTAMMLHAPITYEMLTMLCCTPTFDAHALVWVNTQGYIVGVNAQYVQKVHEPYVQGNARQYDTWVHNALLHTSKTDAIVLHADTAKNRCTIIAQEKIVSSVSASVALRTIHYYLDQTEKKERKGESYVSGYTQGSREHYRS